MFRALRACARVAKPGLRNRMVPSTWRRFASPMWTAQSRSFADDSEYEVDWSKDGDEDDFGLIREDEEEMYRRNRVFLERKYPAVPRLEADEILELARQGKSPMAARGYNSDSLTTLLDDEGGRVVFLVGTSQMTNDAMWEVQHVCDVTSPDSVVLEISNREVDRIRTGTFDGSDLANVFDFFSHLPGGRRALVEIDDLVHGGEYLAALNYAENPPSRKAVKLTLADVYRRPLDEIVREHVGTGLVDGSDEEHESHMGQMVKRFMVLAQDPEYAKILQQLEGLRAQSGDFRDHVSSREFVSGMAKLMRALHPELHNKLGELRQDNFSRELREARGPVVLAVCGLGHMDGVETDWLDWFPNGVIVGSANDSSSDAEEVKEAETA